MQKNCSLESQFCAAMWAHPTPIAPLSKDAALILDVALAISIQEHQVPLQKVFQAAIQGDASGFIKKEAKSGILARVFGKWNPWSFGN